MIKDISDLTCELPVSLACGAVFCAIYLVQMWRMKREIRAYDGVLYSLSVAYVAQMMQIVFFCREPGSRIGVSLRFLETWTQEPQGRAYVLENILLFIPFAIFLSTCLNGMKKHRVYLVPLIGLLTSFLIELLQLKTGRGYFQIDDIIANTAGTVIGFGLYSMVRILVCKFRR